MKRTYHYIVHAHDGLKPNSTNYVDGTVVVIEILHALDEDDATKQAKKLVKRREYRLDKMWECHQCEIQQRKDKQLESADVKEFIKEQTKFLKRENKDHQDEEEN